MPRRSPGRSRARAMREIRSGIRSLTRGFHMLADHLVRHASRAETPKRRTRVSPGRRVHGRYIGLIRNLPPRQKARVRAVRHRKGVDAAIKMAMSLRRSG